MAKKLLKEATVRRFQRLANVAPINEMYHKRDEEMDEAMHGKRDDEMEEGMYNKRDDEMEEGMYHKRDDDMEEGMYKRDDEEVMKEEEEDMDMGDDKGMDMGGEEGGDMDGDLELTDEEAQAIIDLGTKLEQAMGGLDDMDMGDDKGMDMGGDDMGGDDMDDEDLMEALRGISYVPSQGEIVNEVAQRVARRLKQAKLHEAKLNRALGKRR